MKAFPKRYVFRGEMSDTMTFLPCVCVHCPLQIGLSLKGIVNQLFVMDALGQGTPK